MLPMAAKGPEMKLWSFQGKTGQRCHLLRKEIIDSNVKTRPFLECSCPLA